ncbi:MAG: N-acetyl-gamma-glutamyl-phosphate reductase [Alphaproteobacteria bacterium]|nr:N-acetyl-gamma-glutamyl-phosphate reductase [Alphaproteobacteria bacterium]MDA8003703.1 N-acetyl-gamma-glutamyl-phosphate reductase [Alphaproteobacteria bacterium]MDA8006028.1 N-acetyl-gamma-glutamyl-phosphate reductase [Alphaproteobacteria bacterium]MDA8013791.1 N-acetyl-gamma-glutamyl-phosphate reductase [Alphaproteobacteria bacterium]
MTRTVFLDGASGATGVALESLLRGRDDLEVLRLGADERRDDDARRRLLARSELAVLCLPDAAARSVSVLAREAGVRVIDASTAHRVDGEWVYGFPEMCSGQRERIRGAACVSNPGCYATGGVSLLRPLSEAGLLAEGWTPIFQAVSGYSGGGRDLIRAFEGDGGEHSGTNFYFYGVGLRHKHLPEVFEHGGHVKAPMILPSVGRFRRGMLVALPLPVDAWGGGVVSVSGLEDVFRAHYGGEVFVEVVVGEGSERLDPEVLNGTNVLRIHIFGGGEARLLVACLDNLGKGASGAALQNMNLMLGCPETLGLI